MSDVLYCRIYKGIAHRNLWPRDASEFLKRGVFFAESLSLQKHLKSLMFLFLETQKKKKYFDISRGTRTHNLLRIIVSKPITIRLRLQPTR